MGKLKTKLLSANARQLSWPACKQRTTVEMSFVACRNHVLLLEDGHVLNCCSRTVTSFLFVNFRSCCNKVTSVVLLDRGRPNPVAWRLKHVAWRPSPVAWRPKHVAWWWACFVTQEKPILFWNRQYLLRKCHSWLWCRFRKAITCWTCCSRKVRSRCLMKTCCFRGVRPGYLKTGSCC